MRRLRAWVFRAADLFTRDRRDRDLADEIESHLRGDVSGTDGGHAARGARASPAGDGR